jgi:sugar/nucleoside kinase (ribokinase family)
MDVISLGEALIDFTPGKEEGSYIRNPGGAPANFAVGTAKNGLDVAFLGRLGNDDFGVFIAETLEKNRVKILLPELLEEVVTTMAFVTLHEGGERSFTFARKPGADIMLKMTDIRKEDVQNCKVLHAGSFSMSASPSKEATYYAVKLANEYKKMVSFDVNYRDMVWKSQKEAIEEVTNILPYVDLLKKSEEELDFLGGEENIPAAMKKYGISIVIETLGAKGAKYYFDGKSGVLLGREVVAIDATGAGDAFWSGFVSKLLIEGVVEITDLAEEKILSAVKYGNIAGSLCVQKSGGIPSLPNRNEIETLISDGAS